MLVARVLAWCALPLSVCLELLLLGLLLVWFGRRQRLGKVLLTAGVGLLALFSFGPFGSLLVEPLETAYPPLGGVPAGGEPVRWVVVLGSGYHPDPTLPATSRLPGGSLVRLAEGVRVYRTLPGSKLLVLIGGAGANDGRVETVGELAGAFGVPASDLVVDAGGRTTGEEAEVIRGTVGADRFVLVTSAFHMPRAVRLCRDRGLNPTPAPTGHSTAAGEYGVLRALPSAGNLGQTQTAFSEALGWVWRAVGG
jgi:uncharacterized SAM-binding protein YcdF (DUF218 family)